jgi:hypothetical protein
MSVVQWHPHHHVVREPQYTTASGIKTHPRSLTQRRMASRSIKHGPPDMSCMMTRAGLNGTSPAAPVGCGDQFKMVCTSVVVTLSPSQFRMALSSRTLIVYGRARTLSKESSPSSANEKYLSVLVRVVMPMEGGRLENQQPVAARAVPRNAQGRCPRTDDKQHASPTHTYPTSHHWHTALLRLPPTLTHCCPPQTSLSVLP